MAITYLISLQDEITVLRQYLAKQPGPSTAEPVTLPPALLYVLVPHINSAAGATAGGSTSTVTAALTQRTRVLQEENDELYELLKRSETGKLKDEVQGLRRVVKKLEGALKGLSFFPCACHLLLTPENPMKSRTRLSSRYRACRPCLSELR